jgi:thymidylate kinase
LASIRYLFHLRAKKEMVLSDRFYPDLLADPRRYRYGASSKLAELAFKLIPRPDRVIILHTDEETILKRKQEVLPEELARQLECYKSIAEELGERAVLVDCGQELDVVTDEVLEVVLEALAERRR